MRVDFKDLYEGPRFEKRAKNRRYNKLLNIGIAFVFILILFFTYKLIFGGKTEPASTELASETSMNDNEDSTAAYDNQDEEEASDGGSTTGAVTNDESETDEGTGATEEETDIESVETENETIENNSEDTNVIKTEVNSSWKPVGTQQAEPHVAIYDDESRDRLEMHLALQYATGLTEQDWILWRIGNDGGPNKAKGVVSSNDKKKVYRVYIEWIQNQGWKPTKLEQLNEVPPEYTGKKDTNETTDTGE